MKKSSPIIGRFYKTPACLSWSAKLSTTAWFERKPNLIPFPFPADKRDWVMKNDIPTADAGFDVIINGVNKYFADLELSAIACAGFHKENYPDDTVQIRVRADGTLRTVLGHARLE